MFLYGCRAAIVKQGQQEIQLIFFHSSGYTAFKVCKMKKNLEFKIKHQSKMLKLGKKVKVLVLKY